MAAVRPQEPESPTVEWWISQPMLRFCRQRQHGGALSCLLEAMLLQVLEVDVDHVVVGVEPQNAEAVA